MQRDSSTTGRRGAAWAVALLAHAILIWALLQVTPPLPHSAALERMTLIYLPPPDRATQGPASPAPEPPVTAAAPAAHRPSRNHSPDAPAPPSEAAPIPPPPHPEQPPPIDWAAEQTQVAQSQAREHWTQLAQHCRDAEALHIHPPECHRYIEPEPWKPEEKRFGMAGPLPYVRAGRCVLGLGFFGCAVGKKPPPDSHVFDGMRDPDRPGAIPDNGSYQSPAAARDPLH
jgi:hypothetical protein